MNNDSMLCYNSLLNKEDFINYFLDKKTLDSKIPKINLKETYNFYYIDILFSSNRNYFLEIFYKNNFLIFEFYEYNDVNYNFRRIYYLEDINIEEISLFKEKKEIKINIPKVKKIRCI
ncbi:MULTISPECIES: protein phosphatase [Clostridium]|uniref:Protein phosphatase n=1 Tax=Clostridium aquiflavi TaxID=3073603 RepID=A0ABU1EJ83_9CLOT|nr:MULTISPECIES: protein phosphatase [unclassified Clostridium]MDR5588344.1 protein phosphatase [Clostridium sp. 5N-1]NFG62524.1 protein phosphatase [Clostridium botulinum]NFQ10725.1 protein phosphatase [Clostridium botulinum]